MALGEVVGDGRRPRVKPLLGEVLAHLDDLVLERRRASAGLVVWPAGMRLESRVALLGVARTQLLHPTPGEPVVACHRALRASLEVHRGDHEPRQRHTAPPARRCELCLATPANDVLNSHTVARSRKSLFRLPAGRSPPSTPPLACAPRAE